MGSIPALNDEQWLKLLEQVASTFNEVTLSRGFTYFKQQSVVALSISEQRVVQAKVSDHEDYNVTLDLNKLGTSSCTCPIQACCKHVAAVIMELADRLGYPASQIVNASHHVKRVHAMSSPELLLKQLPGRDIVGWHEFLDEYTADVQSAKDQGIYANAMRDELQKIRKASIPFSEVDWILFDLHQELFILRKIKEHQVPGRENNYTSSALYKRYDEIHAWLYQKSTVSNFASSSERLKQTVSFLRQQVVEETGYTYLDYGLYMAMWKYWIAPFPDASEWVSQEINDIEQQTTDSFSTSLSAAKAFLYLQQSRFSEAWKALETTDTLKKAPASLFLSLLQQISVSGDWGILVEWLLKTASTFYGSRNKELDTYLGYWKEAIAHEPESEMYLWKVLEGMLPHSALIVEDLLYEQRKWKPWLEMQIVKGQDPLYHAVSVLQPIEKEAPSLLLPYYHQAVEQYIALKNREHYKLAVRLLKKLEKIYHNIKQPERWERFFTGFMARHGRLRALQEEMKKGKLVE
ncbi:SWIM zinc finger family protein [Paenibacillus agricola]|uniref:SWIM-type domain-containing protein n=1 Tax=Paenibacillus agricola TaxID=2716264 RepID=A0ABX0JLX4_9BACL|nr:SWIM zinc finger family protein [Paenibacillus agricola]NHN35276.1 hypothetical protein [Paenibacillus agricola]